MEPRISMVTLGVADLAKATTFYRDRLGMPTHGDYAGVTFLKLPGTWLALHPRGELAGDAGVSPDGTGFPGFTLAYNVAKPAEVDAFLKRAVDAGGTLVKPARQATWGGYHGYFTDLDGFLWEVAHNPFFTPGE